MMGEMTSSPQFTLSIMLAVCVVMWIVDVWYVSSEYSIPVILELRHLPLHDERANRHDIEQEASTYG